MSLITENFSGGTNGSNLNQTVNTSHTLVNPNNAATLKFSNAYGNPFTGGLIARSTAGSGVAAEYRHDRTAATSGYQLFAFRVPASAPTGAALDFMQTRGTRQNCGMRLGTDGSLGVLNLGSLIGGAATLSNFITTYAGQDAVVQLGCHEGTTSANGRILARLWTTADLVTPVWSYDSGTTRDAGVIGTDTITSYRAKKITTTAVIGNFDSFAHYANDGATTWLANPSLFSGAPSGSLPTRQQVHKFDFASWLNKTSVAGVITDGPALTVNVNGFVVEVVDDSARTEPVDVEFTVTGAGGSTVVTDTIPAGGTGALQAIEKVIAVATTGAASDWE